MVLSFIVNSLDNVILGLFESNVKRDTATSTVLSFLILLTSLYNSKFNLVPDSLIFLFLVYSLLYIAILDIMVYLMKIDERFSRDFSVIITFILSVMLAYMFMPFIVGEVEKLTRILLSILAILLSLIFYQLFYIIASIVIYLIEKHKIRYLYPPILVLISFMMYGSIILIYKILMIL